jgi:signal transduction histidine kinase
MRTPSPDDPTLPLAIQSEFELGRRSRAGSVGQLALLAIFTWAMPTASERPRMFAVLGGSILLANVLRYHLGRRQAAYYPVRRRLWNRLLAAGTLVSGAAWGLLFLAAIRDHGLASYPATVSVLMGSGIAAAMTTSLSPRQGLSRGVIALVIGPSLLQLLLMRERGALAMALIFITYYLFLWAQVRIQNRIYQDGIRYRAKLTEERNRLQSALDAIPGLVSWVGSDLRYRGVNRNFAANYEAEPREFPGQELGFRVADTEFLRAVREFMASPARQSAREIRVTTLGQRRCHWLVMRKGNPEPADPSAREAYLVSIDIHELKEAQAELERQRLRSEMTAKLAVLGELTASIAHDIRNPLTAIRASLELIGRLLDARAAPEPKLRQLADRGISTCHRMEKMVDGLTRFSRQTAEEPYARASLKQIIRDSVELTSPHFLANRVLLHEELPDGDFAAWCRPIEISQALVNLLTNAMDAARTRPERWVSLKASFSEGGATIQVTDSGDGIPEELRPRIFQPFFTTKPAGTGTGLGLSISRRIVLRHGGQLELDPSARHTTFVLRLPPARDAAADGRRSA